MPMSDSGSGLTTAMLQTHFENSNSYRSRIDSAAWQSSAGNYSLVTVSKA